MFCKPDLRAIHPVGPDQQELWAEARPYRVHLSLSRGPEEQAGLCFGKITLDVERYDKLERETRLRGLSAIRFHLYDFLEGAEC